MHPVACWWKVRPPGPNPRFRLHGPVSRGSLYWVNLSDPQVAADAGADRAVPTTAGTPPIRALDYGRSAQPWRLRKRHVVVGALLVGCVAASWIMGRSARERTQDLLYIRQASRHVEPANTIVFESDPVRAQALIDAGTHVALSTD